jgi:antitoxin VapB
MTTLKNQHVVPLYRSNGNQVLCIPHELEFSTDQVILRQDGNYLIIEPITKCDLSATLSTLAPISDDFPDVDSDLLPLRDPQI